MTFANCPKCGSSDVTTAGVCANCGWIRFPQAMGAGESKEAIYNLVGEIEIKVTGKALLDDYKRLLFENNSLTARIAELEEKQRWRVVANGELPEDGEVVWLWDGNNLGMGYYLVFSGQFMDRYTPLRPIKPSHWLPLPEPTEVTE